MKLRSSNKAGSAMNEMYGYLQLGMVDDALAVANQHLAAPRLEVGLFRDLVDGVLMYADKTEPWTPVLRTGFAKLSEPDQRRAGFMMLWFFAQQQAYEEALPFIPKKFTGPMALANLVFAMDTLLSLGRLDEAARLVPQCREGIAGGVYKEIRTMLRSSVRRFEKLNKASQRKARRAGQKT